MQQHFYTKQIATIKCALIFILLLSLTSPSTSYASSDIILKIPYENLVTILQEQLSKQNAIFRVKFSPRHTFYTLDEMHQWIDEMHSLALSEFETKDPCLANNIYHLGFGIEYYTYPNTVKIDYLSYYIKYRNTPEELIESKNRTSAIVNYFINDSMTDIEKIQTLYDYTINTLHFEASSENASLSELIEHRNILAALNRQGVESDGYALLLSQLLTQVGIENRIIKNIDDKNDHHLWNIVKLDGNCYHLDATYGDSKTFEELVADGVYNLDTGISEAVLRENYRQSCIAKRREHFLVSDSTISRIHHTWDHTKYPSSLNNHPSGYDDTLETDVSATVSLEINSDNGIVQVTPSKSSYYIGEKVSLSVTPNPSFSFFNYTDNTNSILTISPSYDIIMEANKTITANYLEDHPTNFTVNIINNNSTISKLPIKNTYIYNEIVTIVCTPNYGYRFENWTDQENKIISDSLEYNFEISRNYILSANTSKINVTDLDFTSDNIIDIEDLALIMTYYGSSKKEPLTNYNRDYDLNNDGNINSIDLKLMVDYYGPLL